MPSRKLMVDALEKYIEWFGGVHEDDCPADDTCDCSGKWINDGVNAAFQELRKGGNSDDGGCERLDHS